PHSGALHQLLEAPLLAAIDELPPEFKMTVMLADIEQLSYREIAQSMNCPIGTVMSRLHRGRRWLRAQLLEHAKAIGLAGDDEAAEGVGSASAASPATSAGAPSSTTVVKEPVELAQYRRTRRAL
ncbi:MAG TPA: sigma factor-like helix-turn-helix DNA-binding protein, partial [Polyangiaceae bacterium]|nr:sigma factor-like helix-turn-helix DNA-binding protein [Polyangiaceae bacterium]